MRATWNGCNDKEGQRSGSHINRGGYCLCFCRVEPELAGCGMSMKIGEAMQENRKLLFEIMEDVIPGGSLQQNGLIVTL